MFELLDLLEDEGGSVVWVWENIQLLNMVYY